MPPELKLARTGNCQLAPICQLYSDPARNVAIGWAGLATAVTIPDGTTFYTRCWPDASCENNGGWTDIYFTTYVSSYLNPGGVTPSMFTAFYDGTPAPPPPHPPPSPSPPRPPVQCAPYLPPNCLPWYNNTLNCCMATATNSNVLTQLLQILSTTTSFADMNAQVANLVYNKLPV